MKKLPAHELGRDWIDDPFAKRQKEQVAKVLEQAEADRRAKEALRRAKGETESLELQEARDILGDDFLGPEEVEKTFGVVMPADELPPLPFSRAELEKAKELGEMLILRVDKTADGKPMSLEAMNAILVKRWEKEGKGGILATPDDWKSLIGKETYTKNTPRSGWALVSKELLPDSTNKDYIKQTEIIIQVLREKTFEDLEMPKEYAEALAEFESQKDRLTKLMSENWQQAAKELSELKINELTRSSIQETIYDLAMYYDTRGQRLLPDSYTWSNSRSTGGSLVCLGGLDAWGVGGSWWGPDYRYGFVGVSLSRRL